jgi:hypothetical protein
MKILNLDLETAPAVAYIWDLKTRYVTPEKIATPKRVICFAAKWVGEDEVFFHSEWNQGHDEMIRAAWKLIDDADAVLHYNGKRFDVPHLNTEFLLANLLPPSPYSQIDLYKAVTNKFAFMSNSLKNVAKMLGTTSKIEHEGFDLWVKVMAGDEEAQARMKEYNIGDIYANEALYERLLPWIPNHPNVGLIAGKEFACPTCGSEALRARGMARTAMSEYRRYQCQDCGKWSRETRRKAYTTIREIAS